MTAITTLLAFLLTISVLIVFHEYGHYRVARACGVKVLRFSVGMGRVLWRYRKTPDSTEFVLSMLPFGGYVTMLGRGMEVAPAERHMSFEAKPLWQRAAIIAAGPGANFLLAIVLFASVHWIGVDEPKAVMGPPVADSLAERAGLRTGDWAQEWSSDGSDWHPLRSLNDLRWQVNQALAEGRSLQLSVSDREGRGRHVVTLPLDTLAGAEVDARTVQRVGLGNAFSEPVLGDVRPGEPAARAGLRAGDRVLSIDDRRIADASTVYELIRAWGRAPQPAAPMRWQVERAGQVLTLPVVPNVVDDNGSKIGRVGVRPGLAPEMVNVRYGPIEGLQEATAQTWQMAVLNLKVLGKMLIGQASVKNLSGPLTIADYAGQSARLGLAYYLGFLAVVSIGLGVLNLLPLPVLDGGHLVYYLYEAVTGRAVSEAWLSRLQNAGVAIVILVMSIALFNDVSRFLGPQ